MVPVAQGNHLGPYRTGGPHPGGEPDHHGHRHRTALVLADAVGDKDQQHNGGDDRKDIGKEHDDVIYALSDSVEIFLQPNLKTDYNHFVLDCMANRYDAIAMNGPDSWNPDWKVKVNRYEMIWTAEVQIPFACWSTKSPKAGTIWKANFCRSTAGSDATSAWSNTPANPGFHTQELFGTLKFQ